MLRSLLQISLVLLCCSSLAAQQIDMAPMNPTANAGGIGAKSSFSPWSLLDGSRITWSHSYSVSFFSGGNSSGSLGMLNSSMLYEISPELTLALNLGVLHNAGAVFGDGEYGAEFLPGFRLDWHPSEKFFMSVSFQRGVGNSYGPSYLGRDYYRRSNSMLIR